MDVSIEAAAAYSERHRPAALLINEGGRTVFERYGSGFGPEKPHALYSGTKSFWGPAAACGEEDGLLTLDERVAQTIPAWSEEPRKARVTLRQILNLTAGFGFGGLGSAVPVFERALSMPLKNEPGTTFTYGGIALQVFGAVLARKLEPRGQSPQDYLRERVLDAAGVRVGSWRELADGTQPLPTGAFLTARDWAAYGAYIADRAPALRACFSGSTANPSYGLGWRLALAGAPDDLVYASGAGGQALYVVPSMNLVVARFGASASFKHEAFCKRLFAALSA